jgi:pheromone shutdown protein TraB
MDKPAPVFMSTHLQHPTTGADVHLLGTAALSTKAAQETRELILKLRPDVVVIEADAAYLAALIDAELNGDPAAALARRRATTFVDVLGIIFSGQLLPVLYDLTYACFGAVLARNFRLCDALG